MFFLILRQFLHFSLAYLQNFYYFCTVFYNGQESGRKKFSPFMQYLVYNAIKLHTINPLNSQQV